MATTPWIQFNATTQTRNVDGVDEYRLIGVSPKPPFNVSQEINGKLSKEDGGTLSGPLVGTTASFETLSIFGAGGAVVLQSPGVAVGNNWLSFKNIDNSEEAFVGYGDSSVVFYIANTIGGVSYSASYHTFNNRVSVDKLSISSAPSLINDGVRLIDLDKYTKSDGSNADYESLTIGKNADNRRYYGTYIGDSIVNGAYATNTDEKWITLLSYDLGFIEDNQGIGGSTMQKGTPLNPFSGINIPDRLSSILDRGDLNGFMIFSIGINDIGYNGGDYNVTNFKRDYRIALDYIIGEGYPISKILIVAPSYISPAGKTYYSTFNDGNGEPSDTRISDYDQATEDIAIEYSIPFIDYKPSMIEAISNGRELLAVDGIHPNTEGHRFIYEFIRNYIRDNDLAGANFTVNGSQVINGGLEINKELKLLTAIEYADNAAAITGGLSVGTVYRTGDLLKIVH